MSPVSILPIRLDDLLHCRGVESERIEFKASWDAATTGPQVLRTVCAFANDYHNLNGGYIVIGAEEQDGRAKRPLKGISAAQVEAAQRWLRGQCNRLDPIYQPVLSPERIDDRLALVVWAPASDTRPHRAPAATGAARYWIRLGSETVDAEQRGDLLRGLIAQTARVPWDDRSALGTLVEDLRETKVREFLNDVRSGLLEEPDAREIYRRMRLVAPLNGDEVPRNIALLCFADDPTRWFRSAKIEVVRFAADRAGDVQEERIFTGDLLGQTRDCLNYIESFATLHVMKQRDGMYAQRWRAYPSTALREALMNAVYHRSYDVDQPEPIKIYIFPSRVEITSYPGPVAGVRQEHLLPNARATVAAPARNRRIGEFLKELGLAEQRLSGLPKIYTAMANNGSPVPSFDFDEDRTYFRVNLPAHPQYVAISAARDAAHLHVMGRQGDAYHRLQTALATDRSSPEAAAILREMAIRRKHDAGVQDDESAALAWGVDGCRGGWFYLALDATGDYCYGVVEELGELLRRADFDDRVFIDIPIGLPHDDSPRDCDSLARAELRSRASSVFPAPARETLQASDHQRACHINRRVTGKKISIQTFHILAKTREADELMLSSRKARRIVREVHPELCFWGLNNRQAMQDKKADATGFDERLDVLEHCWRHAAAAVEEVTARYQRKTVEGDDILDAMAAALTARSTVRNSLPVEPPLDREGLPMQMIWAPKEGIRFAS